VILSLPSVRAMVGERSSAILLAAVALSLALTPTLAAAGRRIAGHLRSRAGSRHDHELVATSLNAPALIVGMGQRGRLIADALDEFDIRYAAIESDPRLMRDAIADGYRVMFGDLADPRIWEPAAMQDRRLSILTVPIFERSSELSPIAQRYYPGLTRMAVIDSPDDAFRYTSIGVVPVVETAGIPGLNAAQAALLCLGVGADIIADWVDRQRDLRGLRSTPSHALAAA
jgi:TrkA-N domain